MNNSGQRGLQLASVDRERSKEFSPKESAYRLVWNLEMKPTKAHNSPDFPKSQESDNKCLLEIHWLFTTAIRKRAKKKQAKKKRGGIKSNF